MKASRRLVLSDDWKAHYCPQRRSIEATILGYRFHSPLFFSYCQQSILALAHGGLSLPSAKAASTCGVAGEQRAVV